MASQHRSASPQSVERIFTVLDHLAVQRAGDSLAGIARRTAAPKTSMVGLLSGMLEGGYLARDAQGRYTLGPRMLSLAMRVTAGTDLTALARPVLAELVRKTGETALLGSLAPDAAVSMYIDKVESPNPVRYTVSLGERRELYSSAIGKLLLAYMDLEKRDQYLSRVPLKAFTPNTITSARRLRAQLAEIREDGLSRTDSERVMGASALAAPVLDGAGTLVAGITLAGPSDRMRANAERFAADVRAAARTLTELVAGRPGIHSPDN